MSNRTRALEKAKKELEYLKKLKKKAQSYGDNPVIKNVIKKWDLDEKIEGAEEFIETATAVTDLVTATASGDVLGQLDAFISQYGNKEVEIFDTGIKEISLGPWFGFLNVDVGFSADMSGELKSERKGATVQSKAKIEANGRARVGLSVGFYIPLVGDCKLGGGVQGGPTMTGKGAIGITYKKAKLIAIMDSARLDVDMVAELYLRVPDFIPDVLLEYPADWISGLDFNDSKSQFEYEFGRITILVVRTPSYSLSFNLTRGEFKYHGAVGDYDVDLNEDIKQLIKDIKEAIVKATDYLNPLNWFG